MVTILSCSSFPNAPHNTVLTRPRIRIRSGLFMNCRDPTLAPGSIASTLTLPLCPGVFLPCHWVPAVWHPAKLPSDNASRGPERLLSATAPPPGMSARTAAFRERWWRFCPPQPSGDTAQECSKAAVVVPRTTRFSRRFARFPVEPPASARRRQQPGERESRGAQVPRRAFAFAPELSNELSVRGDQNNAMHCRKKPRDALAVHTSSCSDVNTHSPLSRRGDRVGRKPATGSQS